MRLTCLGKGPEYTGSEVASYAEGENDMPLSSPGGSWVDSYYYLHYGSSQLH